MDYTNESHFLLIYDEMATYEGQSKITESWLISFYWVSSFDFNFLHI